MFNPLLPDLSKIKDQDLENKILDLSKKYHAALRLGQGQIANQIVITLEAFKDELHQRQAEAMKRLSAKQKEQGVDDLINVD